MDVLDLESLACVDALARTLRFRAAARASALSPAAFGKRVQQVEEQLGRALFLRTTRRVQLTPAGAALLPQIRRLLSDAESLRVQSAAPHVDVVIGSRHELGVDWLLPARRALRDALPHVTVHLRTGSTTELEAAVVTGRADAVVLSRPAPSRAVEAIPLHVEDYALVAAPRLRQKLALRAPEDLARATLLDADDTLPLASYARGARLRFGRVVTLGTIAAIRAAVLDGEGVAVLPRYYVRQDLARGRLARVLPSLTLAHDEFRLLFRADHAHRATLEAIAAQLRRAPLR